MKKIQNQIHKQLFFSLVKMDKIDIKWIENAQFIYHELWQILIKDQDIFHLCEKFYIFNPRSAVLHSGKDQISHTNGIKM